MLQGSRLLGSNGSNTPHRAITFQNCRRENNFKVNFSLHVLFRFATTLESVTAIEDMTQIQIVHSVRNFHNF